MIYSTKNKYQKIQRISKLKKELLVANEQNEILREQIDCLCDTVDSLSLELQKTKQELINTNKELTEALMYREIKVDAAKNLVRKSLVSRDPSELLAVLISNIYGCPVQPHELKDIDTSIASKIPLELDATIIGSQKTRAKSRQLKQQYQDLGCRFTGFKANFAALKSKYDNYSSPPPPTDED